MTGHQRQVPKGVLRGVAARPGQHGVIALRKRPVGRPLLRQDMLDCQVVREDHVLCQAGIRRGFKGLEHHPEPRSRQGGVRGEAPQRGKNRSRGWPELALTGQPGKVVGDIRAGRSSVFGGWPNGLEERQEHDVVVLGRRADQETPDEPALDGVEGALPLRLVADAFGAEKPEERGISSRDLHHVEAVEEASQRGLGWLLFEGLIDHRVTPQVVEDVLGPLLAVGDVSLELREELVRDNLRSSPHRQPVVEEDVEAWSLQAALLDLLAPPVAVEDLPVLLVQVVDRGALDRCGLEQVVLDEVRGEERGAASVEGLEDDLRVVAGVQVDRYDREPLPERRAQGLQTITERRGVAALLRPFDDRAAEEPVRGVNALDAGRRGDAALHRFTERDAVAFCWQHLELVAILVDQKALVEQELLEHLARLIKLVFGSHGTGRRKQQLQGREPLLSIDDGSRLDHLGRDERLLEHYGTEEVGYRVV